MKWWWIYALLVLGFIPFWAWASRSERRLMRTWAVIGLANCAALWPSALQSQWSVFTFNLLTLGACVHSYDRMRQLERGRRE